MFKSITDFIHNIYNTENQVPLHAPVFLGNEKKYIEECIDSTYVSSVGNFVDKFEKDISDFTGANAAVVCVNGTSALHLALQISGVTRNDEVITQSLTFIATCNAISYIGAHPVFIDVDLDTMGLSPNSLEEWLIENAVVKGDSCYNKHTGRRIKACVPMHTFGHPARIFELLEICSKYEIELIEDAAESIGSQYHGKHTGTFGKVGVLSFNGNKTITTGGGGMLLFNDEKLSKYAKHLSTQAKVPHKWEFVHDEIGYNYRMPNINAALGCAQLEKLDFIIENKRETAKLYFDFFKSIPEINFFEEPKNSKSNYWLNTILLKDEKEKKSFLEFSNNNGVMTRPSWRTMDNLPMFKDSQNDGLLNTKWLSERIVNIPSSVRL